MPKSEIVKIIAVSDKKNMFLTMFFFFFYFHAQWSKFILYFIFISVLSPLWSSWLFVERRKFPNVNTLNHWPMIIIIVWFLSLYTVKHFLIAWRFLLSLDLSLAPFFNQWTAWNMAHHKAGHTTKKLKLKFSLKVPQLFSLWKTICVST